MGPRTTFGRSQAYPEKKKVYAAKRGQCRLTMIDGNSFATHSKEGGGESLRHCRRLKLRIKLSLRIFGSNNVTVIDGTSDSVVGTASAGPNPQAIAYDSE